MVSACVWTVSTFRAVGGTDAAAVMTVQHLFSALFWVCYLFCCCWFWSVIAVAGAWGFRIVVLQFS